MPGSSSGCRRAGRRHALRADGPGRIKSDAVATGAGERRPPRQLRQFSPIFPVRDMTAALAHYAALGFNVFPDQGEDGYGFANRDGIGLHLAGIRGTIPRTVTRRRISTCATRTPSTRNGSRPGLGGQTLPCA